MIELADLEKKRVRLLHGVLLSLLQNYTDDIMVAVFSRVAGLDRLEGFREGLKLIMRQFILKRHKQQESASSAQELEQKIERAERALSYSGSITPFNLASKRKRPTHASKNVGYTNIYK